MNPTKNIAELGSLILYYWTYECPVPPSCAKKA